MATIAEMFVDIGADASQFERETKNMQSQMRGLQGDMRTMAADMGTSATQMGKDWRQMSTEMKDAFKGAQEKLKPFKQAQQEVQYEFFKMSQGMKDYKGTTNEFMSELEGLGKRHKTATENMMKNNDMLKMGFIQNVATMLARSGQSEKISANFDRMNNPLYRVNNGLLAVTGNLEKLAKAGTPAVMALKMLGPTANMKELNDMTMLINRGVMRFTFVALAAVAANAIMFGALHKAAMESVPGYKAAFEEMGAAMREAFQPMVDVFGAVMKKVYEFITAIANMAIKFNEAHPVAAKVIQGILMLIVVLTLLLAPLAIGIGLMGGMAVAFNAVWLLIGPLITGLGAMMGTVLLVAAAIGLIAVALWALWTKTDWFKGAVIGAWEAIKSAAISIWDWIYSNAIKPAIDAIVSFITSQMEKVQKFWAQNGEMILQAGKNVWKVIESVIRIAMIAIGAIMQVVWPIVKALVISTWNAIKLGIEGAVNVILGIIQFFAALFTGDWGALWESLMRILTGAVQLILSFLQLSFIGGILKGVKAFGATFGTFFKGLWDDVAAFFSGGITKVTGFVTKGFDDIVSFISGLGQTFFNAGKGLIDMMAKGITSAMKGALDAVKGVASKIRDFLPFSPAKTGPLSDLDHLDFGGPIADSINGAIPKVRGLMSNLLTMPGLGVEGNGTVAGDQYGDVYVQIPINDIEQMRSVQEFFDTLRQTKRARG